MTIPTEVLTPVRKPSYDCLKCPAYCCSYDRIVVENKDLRRLARHFDIDVDTARRYHQLAETQGARIADEEDRTIFLGDFQRGPWFGLGLQGPQ